MPPQRNITKKQAPKYSVTKIDVLHTLISIFNHPNREYEG